MPLNMLGQRAVYHLFTPPKSLLPNGSLADFGHDACSACIRML
jgi:hypothetical protein